MRKSISVDEALVRSTSESFFNMLGGNMLLYHALLAIIIILATMLFGKIVKWLLRIIGQKIFAKTENKIDDEVLQIVLERVIALFGILGIYLGMAELQRGLLPSDTMLLKVLEYCNNILYVVTTIVLTGIIIKILRVIVTHALSVIGKRNNEEQVSKTLQLLLNRVLTFVVVAVAAIVVLDRFDQNISSILTILGAGSLALGLAAQDTISNMISGFVIMIDRPFRVGDRVKIPSGEAGDILEIGLRSTKILDFDNNVIIVPNNELVKTRIVNYSYPKAAMRVVVEVSVAYGSDIDMVKKIMLDAAKKHQHVLPDPAPEVFLTKLADSSLDFSLFCRVGDFKLHYKTAEDLRIAIYNGLNKANIEIPFPQQVVHHKYPTHNALQASKKRKKISR